MVPLAGEIRRGRMREKAFSSLFYSLSLNSFKRGSEREIQEDSS
jgi:hypothetical protein